MHILLLVRMTQIDNHIVDTQFLDENNFKNV